MALHVRYTFCSLPFSAKQLRKMAKFKVFWTTGTQFHPLSELKRLPFTNSAPAYLGHII